MFQKAQYLGVLFFLFHLFFDYLSTGGVVTSMVDDWINYTAKKAFYSVLAKEDFESRFEADLQAHTANIKEEIESRGK